MLKPQKIKASTHALKLLEESIHHLSFHCATRENNWLASIQPQRFIHIRHTQISRILLFPGEGYTKFPIKEWSSFAYKVYNSKLP